MVDQRIGALWLPVIQGLLQRVQKKVRSHGTALPPAHDPTRIDVNHEGQPILGAIDSMVLQDGSYSASLDGINFEGSLLVEIKCPFKGNNSALWLDAANGQIPAHYLVQIQHQLWVSGAILAHFWVFDGTQGLILSVERDEGAMEAIRRGWDAFQVHLDTDTPPPLTDSDTVVREDDAWQSAASAFAAAKATSDAADSELASAREKLVSLARHPKETGAGVSVTRFWKQGAVAYAKVPELKGVALDKYRSKAREEVRVSIT